MPKSADQLKPKLPIVEQISAGGAAFRRKSDTSGNSSDGEYEIVIVAVRPSGRWQLPKGLIDAGESDEQAAVREVREEAGVECETIEKIETVEYWYVGDDRRRGERVRFHKLVHFYLMRYVSGDVADHDHEVAEARWVAPDEAVRMLAFKSEKSVVEKGFETIKKSSK